MNLAVILEAPALILHCPVWVSVRLLHPDTNNVFVVLCIAGYVGNFSKMWWYWTTEFVISFPFHFCIAEKTYMFSSCGRLEAQTIRISGREGNLKSKMYPEDVPPPILKSKHPAFLGFRLILQAVYWFMSNLKVLHLSCEVSYGQLINISNRGSIYPKHTNIGPCAGS